jgi:hypothetical protein
MSSPIPIELTDYISTFLGTAPGTSVHARWCVASGFHRAGTISSNLSLSDWTSDFSPSYNVIANHTQVMDCRPWPHEVNTTICLLAIIEHFPNLSSLKEMMFGKFLFSSDYFLSDKAVTRAHQI